MTNRRQTVLVIGGGAAGIAAAWQLRRGGMNVTLVDRRSSLGGRLTSHAHEALPTVFDNGPHLFLDSYRQAMQLFRELEIDDCFHFPWPLEVPYAFAAGSAERLTAWLLPSPLNFAAGLLNFKPLWVDARMRTVKAILKLIKGPVDSQSSIQQWLEKRTGEEEVHFFWKPLVSATMNANMADVSVAALREVFRSGFCSPLRGGRMGYCRYPLKDVFHDKVLRKLESAGITVRLNEAVIGAEIERNRIKWVSFQQGGKSCFDHIVAALPPAALRKFAGSFGAGEAIIKSYQLDDWRETAISNLYLWARQRPLLDPVTCTPDGPFDWVFDYGRLWGNAEAPLCLMFGQRSLVDLKKAGVTRDLVLEKLSAAFPTLRCVDWMASRFSQEARAISIKPHNLWGKTLPLKTDLDNLTLAGDWLDPVLPPTVEAGVRVGFKAADKLLYKYERP
ncbi:FAD-dependent oxidoreductase [bacterium]|nr:FAD-dependent oxidoreductase [bacterium]MBU1880949.1 FAD-dependent oxidoreductase [bacterium]